MITETPIRISQKPKFTLPGWQGSTDPAPANEETLAACLRAHERHVFVLQKGGEYFISNEGNLAATGPAWQLAAFAMPFGPADLGDPGFKSLYGTRYALYSGSMANGIASEDLVVEMGNAGFMGFFGSGGLLPGRVENAIQRIQSELNGKPFGFNLLNSPFEPALEQGMMDVFFKHGIHTIEASAYLTITTSLVRYRAAGLSRQPDGSIRIENRIIAKVSRKEVASKFLQPPSEEVVRQLVADGKISQEQAELARFIPMADDITVEADSGGHTDNRPLVGVLPSIIRLRDTMQAKHQFAQPVRVGAGGGIGTPSAALAAFMMGAAYVVTGSINQSCVEAGASEHTRNLLALMDSPDVAMAPASDMFEMGVRVQVLKRGTMFAMRAQKLYELYQRYDSIEDIPTAEREKLETTVFQRKLDDVWVECVKFFTERDPRQIERAEKNPKDKMALVFRWYLGLSSRWSNCGEKGREMDYQIWTGPSMGAFNDWVKGTYLESPSNRAVADISMQIMKGAAYLMRIRTLETQGVRLAPNLREFIPSRD